MIKYLFASHGRLAEGVKNSLNLIMGPQDDVEIFSAYAGDNNDVVGSLEKKLTSLSLDTDTWIVVTDIFGGSVNNYLLTELKSKKFYLITGLSLPLALNLKTKIVSEDTDIIEHIKEAIEDAKKQIIFCNELNSPETTDSDNDF
ncbi:hypothetical protein EFR95_06770 [Lactobacillus amylovorus]|uniref:PTS sugar transporter subunit IIA n=1 Tax=Lactobacillus amylovorus TaxID=1604 RepID=UPI0021A64B87|nr:PTS mannose transporter subunit IIA [Lactobacillus amylovorus]MCT3586039.1 hypothetical protein [Lactobacillus amylovorus]